MVPEVAPHGQRETVCWRSRLGSSPGVEQVHLGGGVAEGALLAFLDDGTALDLRYQLLASEASRATELKVQLRSAAGRRRLSLAGSGTRWTVDERPAPVLDGCQCVDLWPSAFTNTLAIRHLRLAVGGRAELDVVYVDGPRLSVRRARQQYTREGARRYHFSSEGFSAQLEVDERALVVSYPPLFTRLTPRAGAR